MDNVKLKKEYSSLMKRARELTKEDCCFLCKKKVSSFCNSHSIPQFVMKNVSYNGKVLVGENSISKEALLLDDIKGINNSWTFFSICNECDNVYFKNYENESNLDISKIDNEIMAEIALKNFLQMIYKRKIEKKIDELLSPIFINEDVTKKLDLRDFTRDLNRAKNIIDKNLKSGMKIIFYRELDYVVPIAVQQTLSVYKDYRGYIVNDVLNAPDSEILHVAHIAVFPLKHKSVILVFSHKDDTNWRVLQRSIELLNYDDQLIYVSYLIFKFTENYVISPRIDNNFINNENLIKLSKESYDYKSKFIKPWEGFDMNCKLVDFRDVPCVFDKQFRLDKQNL